MSSFFTLLVHAHLVPALRRAGPALRSQVQKTLERLQLGYWDAGTRVRLLRGVRKPVYEARVNRADRLLFTVVRTHSPAPPYPMESYLLVWDLVTHDKVDRARRANLQPEAGFLDFEELAALELSEPPPAPDVVLPEGVPADPGQALALIQDPGAARPATDELVDSVRWYQLDPDLVLDDAGWQALLDDDELEEMELKLSVEQATAVWAPGPVLLRGTAGSGKTTVSVYRLARAAVQHPGARLLYVTYSEALLASVQRLFHSLHRARRCPLPQRPPEFLTFRELYARLAGQDLASGQLLRYPVFDPWYRMVFGQSDSALAWEEIRSIVKGACLETDRDCLTFAEYEELGRKRAPLFVSERPRLYRVFRKYREWCQDKARYDDVDLARRALANLRRQSALRYDQVICDEGQDLTELEMQFLLDLGRDLSGLLFAADPQQIVNPSGFRWAEIRSLIRSRRRQLPPPEVCGLTRNYRSVQSIVSLANVLLSIQRERTGRSDDDELQNTTLQGPSPVLVTGDEEETIRHVRGFGPRCAVIVPSPDDAERVGRRIESARVFDVFGVKGLEFDACVLWNVIGRDLDIWRRVLTGHEPLKEDPVVRRALHHAYVAVTRARRYLGVYEQSAEAAALWLTPPLRTQIERDEPAALAKFMLAAASPAQWRREGEYFRTRQRFRQAAECFRRAGDERRELEAMAAFHASVEEFAAAAALFVRLEQWPDAARAYEAAGNLAEAAPAYVKAGLWADAARVLERSNQWQQAAEAYRTSGDTEGTARCLQHHYAALHNWEAAARVAEEVGDTEAAAGFYDRAHRKDKARELRLAAARKRRDYPRVAQLCEEARDYEAAAKAYTKLKKPREAARCRALAAETAGDAEGAIRRWCRLGQYARADALRQKQRQAAGEAIAAQAREAETRQDLAAAVALWEKAGDRRRAAGLRARRAEAEERWLDAASAYEAAGQATEVSRCLQASADPRAGHWLTAITALRSGDSRTALTEFEAAENYAAAVNVGEKLIDSEFSSPRRGGRGYDWDRVEEESRIDAIVERCKMRHAETVGSLSAAVQCRGRFRHPENERYRATLCERLGQWSVAARTYMDLRDHVAAQRCFEKAGDRRGLHRARALAAEERGDYAAAAESWAALGSRRHAAKSRARVLESQGRYAEAADAYAQGSMPAQARRCRALAEQSVPPSPADEPARRRWGWLRSDPRQPPLS